MYIYKVWDCLYCMMCLHSNHHLLSLSQDSIVLGAGATPIHEYESFIFYHNNTPKWNETFKVYIYMYMYIRTCIIIYVHVLTLVSTCLSPILHVYYQPMMIHVCISILVHVCTCTCTYMYIHVYTYMYICTCTYVDRRPVYSGTT